MAERGDYVLHGSFMMSIRLRRMARCNWGIENDRLVVQNVLVTCCIKGKYGVGQRWDRLWQGNRKGGIVNWCPQAGLVRF